MSNKENNYVDMAQKLCEKTDPHGLRELVEIKVLLEDIPNFPKFLQENAKACGGDEYEYHIPKSSYTVQFIYHGVGIIVYRFVKDAMAAGVHIQISDLLHFPFICEKCFFIATSCKPDTFLYI